MAPAIFLMTASFVLVKTGRDALFVEDLGVCDLPLAHLAIAGLPLPVAVGMLALLRAAGPRDARVLALAGSFGVIVGVLIELQFYWAASTSGTSGLEQSICFANLHLLLNGMALTVDGMGAHLGEGLVAARLYLWLGGHLGAPTPGETGAAWLDGLPVASVGFLPIATARLAPFLREPRPRATEGADPEGAGSLGERAPSRPGASPRRCRPAGAW